MAIDLYLTIPGIPGESQSTFRLPGGPSTVPMELHSFSWGMSNTVNIGRQSGSGAGRAQFSDLNIAKNFDSASPLLMTALTQGTLLKSATLSLVKSSSAAYANTAYLTYQLQDVAVTAISDSGADSVEESISFAFGLVTVTYVPQDAKGMFGKPIVFHWNIEKNTL